MLNKDSLSQLKGLKQQMEAEKERAEAVVKGTQARYGFAVLDDGRVIELGDHSELLKQDGVYARLFLLQAEGYR